MTRYFGVHTLEGEWHSLLPRYLMLSERVRGKKVLDIGCGTGIGSSLLLELGAAQVNAIDHRPAVLEIARLKHAKEGLDFHVMFWEELDFADDTFDIVLCLDPTSPVTDPSLLLEIKRVLRAGGEYICAIEQRNIEGFESILPRYGYTNSAENIELSRTGERVPQLGQLAELFESVIPLIQRPHYSYIFDVADAPGSAESKNIRRTITNAEESGLWIGASPEEAAAEGTDQRPGRWIHQDERLCDRDGDPAAVQVLFCGDAQMAPPQLREVKMPLMGLLERLQQLISDMQVHQHPAQESAPFHIIDDPSEDIPPARSFTLREQTSEFYAPSFQRSREVANQPRDEHSFGPPPSYYGPDPVQDQLDQMTTLYQQMRHEMEGLFLRTRQELEQRDRYIEHLVGTVQSWQQRFGETPATESDRPESAFESAPTSVFQRPLFDDDEDQVVNADESGADLSVEADKASDQAQDCREQKSDGEPPAELARDDQEPPEVSEAD